MKLTVLGGGGVRAIFLARSIASSVSKMGINQVVFMDNDETKLNIYGKMSKNITHRIDPTIDFQITTDPVEAIKDADFIITTIRVGQEDARVFDEELAMKYNVLGQETTGVGGFAMALRSVPILLDYCKMIKEHAKENVLIFNFTNPSGLVTQALRLEGFDNVYGICDAPSSFIKQLQDLLDCDPKDFSAKCFGLNHLSWFDHITVKGEDVTQSLLEDDNLYTKTEMRLFEKDLVELTGNLMINEYLYFFYHENRVMDSIDKLGTTRGKTIQQINRDMLKELLELDIDIQMELAFKIYLKYFSMRQNSYFSIESGQEPTNIQEEISFDEFLNEKDDEGYAGVALDFIRAYQNDEKTEMVLSIPNGDTIPELDPTDVIEIMCEIKKGEVKAIPVDAIPRAQMNMIHAIKTYERKTIQAILQKDKSIAVDALMGHPLIRRYDIAKGLVDELVEEYKEYVGVWS